MTASSPKIALLGTGTMGAGMTRSLLRAGLPVTVWNRTVEKARPLADDGATVAESAADAVREADVVITMLFDADSVESVIGDVADAIGDAVWLQSSTIGPDGTARLARLADERGLTFVDGPVLGTKGPAEQGKLVMLVSGPADAIDRAQPALDAMGSRTMRLGDEPGRASALKIVANAFIGTLTAAIAQSVALAESLGLDPADFTGALAGGASDSPYVQVKGKAMIEGTTEDAQFQLDGVLKDLRLARGTAEQQGVTLSLLDGAVEAYDRASGDGHGSEDMAGVVAAFRPAG
ncbi:NAD(P)-dependent oxidoreductase [Amnibacterium endophyticum]|uniref:NAD(P)-dependent oxidoreductase n=1 Tax=Amnibacterium endophyticum TaxID=2109337 RepID=A0ABW4LEZ0_9MICO